MTVWRIVADGKPRDPRESPEALQGNRAGEFCFVHVGLHEHLLDRVPGILLAHTPGAQLGQQDPSAARAKLQSIPHV